MPAANRHVTTFTTPSDTDVVVTRTFDAPRALVFEAHTSCKHMPNWMGPYGWTMSECKNDLRPGGEFRYTWSKPGGNGITITGMNKEVSPPSRIVSTESWGEPWPVSTNTMEFTEHDGQTTLVMTIRYSSKEARDMALGTGMKDGMTTGYERLDEYLGTLN
jgi:uncharacterized protein YndB with AHSA1/START domain